MKTFCHEGQDRSCGRGPPEIGTGRCREGSGEDAIGVQRIPGVASGTRCSADRRPCCRRLAGCPCRRLKRF